MKKQTKWLLVAFAGAALAAPNSLVIRVVSTDIDPYALNAVRFLLAGLIFLPYLLRDMSSIKPSSFKWLFVTSASLVIAGTTYTMALAQAPASYVSLFGLMSPVLLVAFASVLMNERITKRAFSGVIIAGVGAFVLAAIPLITTQNLEFRIYPFATLLALLSAIMYPFYVVASKEVTYKRVHVFAVISFSSLVASAASALIWFFATDRLVPSPTPQLLAAMVFMGVVVLGLSRALSFVSYRHISSPLMSGMYYVEAWLAVLLPVVIIGEKLSFEMLVGGALIMLGVYVSGHHKYVHPHHHTMKP